MNPRVLHILIVPFFLFTHLIPEGRSSQFQKQRDRKNNNAQYDNPGNVLRNFDISNNLKYANVDNVDNTLEFNEGVGTLESNFQSPQDELDNDIDEIIIESDIQSERNNILYAEGNVTVSYQGKYLKSDKLIYDKFNKNISAKGNVSLIIGEQIFKLSQKETIKELSRIATKNNILLIIRVHPNFHNSSKESKKIWSNIFNDLPKKNTLIIKEKDEFSSYKVIKNSDIVIVYGSTIGIEATFLEKPVIITGSSFYFGTKAKIYPVFTLKNLEKNIDNLLFSFDNNQENQRLIRESSYPYGYWAYTHGFRYKYFSAITPNKGYFLKQDLQKLHRILSFFKKILKGLILSK